MPENPKLIQRKFFRRVQSYEITPEHDVRVGVRGPFKEESWLSPLACFDPSPTRIRRVDLKPLVLVAPLALIAVPSLIAAFVALFTGKPSAGIFAIAGFFGIPCVGFTWLILRSTVNVLSYVGSGGARLTFWFNNPDQKTFEDFIKVLELSIKEAQAIKPEDRTLAGEIQKLKDLFDRGILDKDQFESAKNRLTGNEGARKIGF